MANYYDLSYDDCKHKLINILLDIRFNNKNENTHIELFLKKINWMLSNKDYIKKILNIYDILGNIFDQNESITIIERTLKEQNLRYITHKKKNPIITTKVNECFYKKIAFLSLNEKLDGDKLTEICSILKNNNFFYEQMKKFNLRN